MSMLLIWASLSVSAQESVDYIAEHLIESGMNLNYQTLPEVPLNDQLPSTSVTLGGGQIQGDPFSNQFPHLSFQHYFPQDDNSSWSMGVFYQRYQFSSDQASILVQPSFGKPASIPESFNASITQTNGNGQHFGVSAAWNRRLSWGDWLQLGFSLEIVDINRFRVDFDSLDLPDQLSGFIDYAGTYQIVTPWLGYRFRPQRWSAEWRGVASTLIGYPQPHQGFKGRFTGPGFDFQNSTDEIGRGKHIPDPFLGVRYRMIYQPANLSIDLGGSLFSLLFEPKAHKGIKPPFFLAMTYRF